METRGGGGDGRAEVLWGEGVSVEIVCVSVCVCVCVWQVGGGED